MIIKNLSEVAAFLPEASGSHFRITRYPDEYKDEKVLLIDGDISIENLDLDSPEKTFPLIANNEYVRTIICTGNFSARNIYNENDDGSTGLIVEGSLHCQNMVIGGQEIVVKGDLVVKECFWGNYNHGDLMVQGKTEAAVFLITEDYHDNIRKDHFDNQVFIADYIDLEEENEFTKDRVQAVFYEELLEDADELDEDEIFSWSNWLHRYKCIEWLSENKRIIRENFQQPEKEEVVYPQIFTPFAELRTPEDWKAQVPNFEKLLEIAESEPDNRLEFEKDGWFVVLVKKSEEYPTVSQLIAENEVIIVSIAIEKVTKKSLFKTKSRVETFVSVRALDQADPISIFETPAPPKYYQALNEVLTMVFRHAERGAYYYQQFLQEVQAAEIHQFCTLPVITGLYNDWEDSDKNGFSYSGKNYAFCMPLEKWGSAMLRITKAIPSEDDEYDCRGYNFDTDSIESPTQVALRYNYSQNERIEGRYKEYGGTKVYFFDDELYEEALKWYRKARVHIPKVNEKFLRGEWEA